MNELLDLRAARYSNTLSRERQREEKPELLVTIYARRRDEISRRN